MEFVVPHGPLDAEQTLAAALSLDDPDAAPLGDPLGALLRDDCPWRASSVHERAGRQWRCGALEAVRVLAAAGARSTLWRRYRDEVRAEVVLPGVLADRVVPLSRCVQDQFRAGRDREAIRCARSLGALLERVSPPELLEARHDGSRDMITREVGRALLWARVALDRLQSPSSATRAAAHETAAQRVERLVGEAMECTTRARPPFVAPCSPLDELEAMGDEAVAPMIDAIERDERSLRIGAWSKGGSHRYEFVPAPVREALFPIVSARIRVETTAHTLFYQRAPGPPVAAALRLAWNAQSHRSAAALDADDWSSSNTPCAAIDAIAQRWLDVPRLPWQPRVQFAPIIVRAVVRAAVVAHSAAIARRCDGAINPLVLLALVDLAHAPLLAAAVYEATSVKSDELFEAASFVLAHSEDPHARGAFALRHFECSDRSLAALAARLDVLGPLADRPELTVMVRRVLRERGRDVGEPLFALIEATGRFAHTELARQLLAPALMACEPIGELVIDDERKALVIVGGSRTPVAPAASATPGRSVWRSCDAAALRLCADSSALVDVVRARAPALQRCIARGPRASSSREAVPVRAWLRFPAALL